VLVDGEHYPPVVAEAISQLRASGHDVLAAVFCGGVEKLGAMDLERTYGVQVLRGQDREATLVEAVRRLRPDAVVDLSDEPVVSSVDRFRLAGLVLGQGVPYRGADFELEPVRFERVLTKQAIRVIATGKRVGKTAIAGALARHAVRRGRRPVIVAMGRGGPPDPVLLEVGTDLSPAALLKLADAGNHAASDYIEDAVTSRVTTIGCYRVGGGLAGAPFTSNVVAGARMAESRPEDLVILEGSGAAVPPVEADGGLICVPAHADEAVVRGHLGPYRLLLADLAVVTMAEQGTPSAAMEAAIREVSPGIDVVRAVFRPLPLSTVVGKRVFFCSTAPPGVGDVLKRHLEAEHGCEVVALSHGLADRVALHRELDGAPDFDILLTELKAAAVDVAVRAAAATGHEVVFADNALVGEGIEDAFDRLLAKRRATEPVRTN
jgi:cyclic 2,3-diphosphoglycerate synthetase